MSVINRFIAFFLLLLFISGNTFAATQFFSVAANSGGPTKSFNFLNGTLDPSLTFTRASSATYYNSSGIVTSATTNAPRFDYDPTTLLPKGLLLEEQRTNANTLSNTLSSYTISNASVSANASTSPDGSSNANLLLDNATTGAHNAFTATVVSANAVVAVSAYIKQGTGRYIQLWMGNGTPGVWITFDSQTGTITEHATLTGGTYFSSKVQSLPNGWYRISFIGSLNAANPFTGLSLSNSGTPGVLSPSYSGTGTGNYAYGLGLEVGAFLTSYIPTVGSAATRAVDNLVTTSIPWFNASQGTWFQEQILEGITPFFGIMGIFGNSSDTTNILFHGANAGNTTLASQSNPGGGFSGGTLVMPTFGVNFKYGVSYGSATNSVASRGVQDSNGNWGTVAPPAGITQYNFLGNVGNGGAVCGWVRNFSYFNTALPPTLVTAISGVL